MGDPTTEEGKALLMERSPLNFAQNIQRPLLIGQGANAPRVNVAESDRGSHGGEEYPRHVCAVPR